MTTARDLIKASLKTAALLGEGQEPSGEQANDALARLNDIVSSWNTDGLVLYATENNTVTTVPGQSRYTVGTGGDFNIQRPVRIHDAYIVYQNISFALEIINQKEYNDVVLKNLQNVLLRYLLYINEYPLGIIQLWPVPQQAIQLTLTVDRFLTALTLDTVLSFPPGFEKALRMELAIELCPEYAKEPSPTLVARWKEAKANLKRANYQPTVSEYDSAILAPREGLPWFLAGY